MNTCRYIFRDEETYGLIDTVIDEKTIQGIIKNKYFNTVLQHPSEFACIVNGKIIQPGPFSLQELEPYL